MKLSLILCTYMRPRAILTLLSSVETQVIYPDEIIIVDGSIDDKTCEVFKNKQFKNLKYFKVSKENRGLTNQRNFGISKVSKDIDIVCFLDDDVVLETTYFKKIIETYKKYPEAGGVGGYITNEVTWKKLRKGDKISYSEYQIDGYVRHLGSRNVLRKKLGLLSNKPPCIMPDFANGFSIGNLPPNNKIYEVEHFIGCAMSFAKKTVDEIKFSNYFQGYGLYEDSDYCLRVSKKYKQYLNTGARLSHHHEAAGRPNKYKYGKMVTRNGWYIWRLKFPKPSLKARLKWNSIVFLLTIIRFSNIFTTQKKKEAFTESLGRTVGWFSLLITPPKIKF